jgi:hypothetical protein
MVYTHVSHRGVQSRQNCPHRDKLKFDMPRTGEIKRKRECCGISAVSAYNIFSEQS